MVDLDMSQALGQSGGCLCPNFWATHRGDCPKFLDTTVPTVGTGCPKILDGILFFVALEQHAIPLQIIPRGLVLAGWFIGHSPMRCFALALNA